MVPGGVRLTRSRAAISGRYDAVDQLTATLKENKVFVLEGQFQGDAVANALPANPISNGFINFFRPFFDPLLDVAYGKGTAGGIQMSLDQIRIMVVLHEVSHLTGRYRHPDPDDRPGLLGPKEYVTEGVLNQRIFEACFPPNEVPVPGYTNARQRI